MKNLFFQKDNRKFFIQVFSGNRDQLRFSIPFVILIFLNSIFILVIELAALSGLDRIKTLLPSFGTDELNLLNAIHLNLFILAIIGLLAMGLITFWIWTYYSRRIFGAAAAIERKINQLRESDFHEELKLREQDEFKRIAVALNQLSEKMKNRN